ncbi:hypothetical protein SARC_07764 [Sphaeroforma arctica JP610]|uniref:Uncharacterized protein n=1 Tax=Sphaeroforma arctica JP610 TaxID=667725 RepID=A0A0L0FSS3_9EUKA|nr:hypothetical protein SARC_07764 [Sphaeroforma arctica JP610]KNC79857.1 hypothetical protein SARC_07764 [Sphaeroforma arctica JP610]|eukprot:XP_014153759.1 hypothetical protein SARC_07764 [Sphaeroforma arctica JP610]
MGISSLLKSGTFFRSKSHNDSANTGIKDMHSSATNDTHQQSASRCPVAHLNKMEKGSTDTVVASPESTANETSDQTQSVSADAPPYISSTKNKSNCTDLVAQVQARSRSQVGSQRPQMTMDRTSTSYLLQEIGGKEAMVKMVTRFYEHAFKDKLLDTFIMNHNDPHGERLGLWLADKMGDIGVWSNHRPTYARQMAHHRSWYSHKRAAEDMGNSFQLKDCVVWMRLMFWSARQEGLMENVHFREWFIFAITLAIRVYEYTAPPHTRACADWSLKQENIRLYQQNGYSMPDLDQFQNRR